MKVLERHATYGPFLERLASAPARVLLLDYDGTLAPFVVDRTLALPYPQVPPLIVRIMARGTRVVLISGRPVREFTAEFAEPTQFQADLLDEIQRPRLCVVQIHEDGLGMQARQQGEPVLEAAHRQDGVADVLDGARQNVPVREVSPDDEYGVGSHGEF